MDKKEKKTKNDGKVHAQIQDFFFLQSKKAATNMKNALFANKYLTKYTE